MYEESVRFFEHVFRSDGRVLDRVDADYTFVNAELAKFYGLVGQGKPAGSQKPGAWWRVDGLKAGERWRPGNGQPAVEAIGGITDQSGAARQLGGRTMLGEKLPNLRAQRGRICPTAKPNQRVDGFGNSSRNTGKWLCVRFVTTRVDPFGFALESFDAIGRLRQKDLAGRPIDTRVPRRTERDSTGLAACGIIC
ncbi:MAG: hypothetical protein Ct9H300mP1_28020 [Planctomycetaceae bacterium]|nr:MAG: hypothetical protein Ct9H300mP1_28020 [Planctomycetaceae bacterium]